MIEEVKTVKEEKKEGKEDAGRKNKCEDEIGVKIKRKRNMRRGR